MPSNKLSYKQAIQEAEIILQQIENDELDVDELTHKVKRAAELLKICRDKLKNTEKEVEKIINEIDTDNP
ncbi:MAG: exodeoxyribonuclease VII small subunit [Bacteroidales bacterium]|nr:exodeoxyribonuclease VII small subunit [Bacteroidales bacterium]